MKSNNFQVSYSTKKEVKGIMNQAANKYIKLNQYGSPQMKKVMMNGVKDIVINHMDEAEELIPYVIYKLSKELRDNFKDDKEPFGQHLKDQVNKAREFIRSRMEDEYNRNYEELEYQYSQIGSLVNNFVSNKVLGFCDKVGMAGRLARKQEATTQTDDVHIISLQGVSDFDVHEADLGGRDNPLDYYGQ